MITKAGGVKARYGRAPPATRTPPATRAHSGGRIHQGDTPEGCTRHGHSRVTPPRAQPGYTATGVPGWPPMSRYRAWRSAGGCGVLFLLDEFALDPDLDFLADDEPAIQDRVEAQAELLPVDLGRGAVRDPVSHHPGVVELAVLRHVEGYRAGVALDGQDAGALEREERVLLHLEEVGRADVVVSHRVVGTEAGGRDGHLDRRLLGVAGVDVGDRAELVKVAPDRHHPQVLGGEFDLRVVRVELPVAHRGPPCSASSLLGRGRQMAVAIPASPYLRGHTGVVIPQSP